MLTIIHGDDVAASRNALHELKQKKQDMTMLEGEAVTLTDIHQVFDGGGFFVTEKSVVIEQLLSKRKTSKELDAIISYLREKTLEHEIILWESKDLDKKSLSRFPHSTVKGYNLPQSLFLFLDTIKPGNGQKLSQLFHTALQTTEPEMILFMLVRQVRILLALSEKGQETIDEVKRLAPWQANKLQKQALLFKPHQLISMHRQLFHLDKKMKTGDLDMSLSLAIDIFLLRI